MFSLHTLSARACFIFALLVLFFPPSPLFALDIGERVQIHGFLSQGYIDSRDNNFLGETEHGTSEFREIGLNLNARLSDRFRVGGQALYRDFAETADGDLSLDWLVADYHATDLLGIRIGKIKLPMGLYNMERDSDFLRPLIFLPQSIYDESRRDSWQALWGGEVYGNLLVGDWGDMDYQLFGGRINYDDDSLPTRASTEIVDRFNRRTSSSLTTEDLSRENKYIYGAALFMNPPIDGLRGALTFLALEDETRIHDLVVSELKVHGKLVVSLEYSLDPFSLSAEYSESDRKQQQFGISTLDGRSQAWYVLLSYSPIPDWTFSLLYDAYYRLKKQRSAAVGSRNLYPWRKDFGVALRYDITENWTFKAEWHTIDGTAFYMNYVNPDGVERFWQYGALKLTFNF